MGFAVGTGERVALLVSPSLLLYPGANMIAWKKRMKDGRHVGLDFYDLLIEPILYLTPT
jgi:hypothetical protein